MIYYMIDVKKMNPHYIFEMMDTMEIVVSNPYPEGAHDLYDGVEFNIIVYYYNYRVYVIIIMENRITYCKEIDVYDYEIEGFEPYITPDGVIISSKPTTQKEEAVIKQFFEIIDMKYL